MKLCLYFILPFLFLFPNVTFCVEAPSSLDLKATFEAALKRSEIVADQEELLKQAEEHYSQAMGSVLPTISGIASYTRQKEVTSATGNALFPSAQPLVRLNATQPLFRGLRDLAAIQASRYLIHAQEEIKKQALRQLYIDVAQNYYVTLSFETDLK
ncbi:MAG: TolC family protein, partial [Deltaproteobacteria bacterium]